MSLRPEICVAPLSETKHDRSPYLLKQRKMPLRNEHSSIEVTLCKNDYTFPSYCGLFSLSLFLMSCRLLSALYSLICYYSLICFVFS